jgi:hypothetical protein
MIGLFAWAGATPDGPDLSTPRAAALAFARILAGHRCGELTLVTTFEPGTRLYATEARACRTASRLLRRARVTRVVSYHPSDIYPRGFADVVMVEWRAGKTGPFAWIIGRPEDSSSYKVIGNVVLPTTGLG